MRTFFEPSSIRFDGGTKKRKMNMQISSDEFPRQKKLSSPPKKVSSPADHISSSSLSPLFLGVVVAGVVAPKKKHDVRWSVVHHNCAKSHSQWLGQGRGKTRGANRRAADGQAQADVQSQLGPRGQRVSRELERSQVHRQQVHRYAVGVFLLCSLRRQFLTLAKHDNSARRAQTKNTFGTLAGRALFILSSRLVFNQHFCI